MVDCKIFRHGGDASNAPGETCSGLSAATSGKAWLNEDRIARGVLFTLRVQARSSAQMIPTEKRKQPK
ncbi:hypothetical protein ACCAA_30042 [Candidatus Accumulibacter aalborgensis]|uniref:Uncharacterized protein n=1 Tax=Candidatus Accumulibacter aalborgensis TaxID=1860102 RepID=A0A1A8XQ76_9PROT|nr:hypothetical protein ACCAA_30042 [Candidatus Accumulibacter aalborgensis]